MRLLAHGYCHSEQREESAFYSVECSKRILHFIQDDIKVVRSAAYDPSDKPYPLKSQR